MSENTLDDDEDSFRRQKPRILEANNRELYFSFVDFITALVARYLYRCGSNEMWHYTCFSILAKWATKLKLLEKDPLGYAAMSLENADDLDDEKDQLNYIDFFLEKKWEFGKEEKFTPANMYHSIETLFRDILFYIFSYCLRSPWVLDASGHTNEAFEVTTRVYRNGIDDSHTAISSSRDGEFAAANDAKQLRYVRTAIDILLSGARQIEKNSAQNVPDPNDAPENPEVVTMKWNWTVADLASRPSDLRHSPEGMLNLKKMDDVVSMMTANALASVDVSSETIDLMFIMRHYLQVAMTMTEPTDEFVDEDLSAHINVFSKGFVDSKDRRPAGNDFKSLSEATLFGDRMLPGKEIPDSSQAGVEVPKRTRLMRIFRRDKNELEQFRASMARTASWRFDEKAVIIPCRTYVRTCLAIALIIVCGGLAIPFTSRVRLHGVDPFNIASFSWIAVVFLLFLAQSRYVPQWAWHDFLHSRIVCRNVTELADVSALDPQIVLYKLLITEKSNDLHTRGPYNSMFSRISDDGISINVPCTTSTLYASGFVLFLGIGKTDRHIQVNDARPVSEYFAASHRNWQKCMGVPLPLEYGAQTTQTAHQNVLRLRVDEFEGERILGLFVGNRSFG